jgi:DNA polymerase-3 subunit gamma/tau
MSYQVLARKWRPQVFEDVVGQGHITRTLQNAIATDRLAHAFLFSGPRGVGKTTTARILAKALNCKEGPTPHPCGTCDSCRETAAGTAVDVIEIDGASNRGIEHIRELREAVRYAPSVGKHKVYVIDEVHMLTNEAFNALLKTLEEPPPHVIFIFATTEPQKIPATIHSRCQRYGFKRVALQDIAGRLRTIAGAEGITISDQGLIMIARAAEGSMRDSQSLLDQAVSYSGSTVPDTDLQAILGTVSQNVLRRFADRLLERDAAGLVTMIDELLEQGQDQRQLLAGVVEHLRNLVVAKTTKEPARIIELAEQDLAAVQQQAAAVELERLLMLFDSLARTQDELRWSPHQRFTLEVGVVKACSIASLKPLSELLARVRNLESLAGAGGGPPAVRPAAVREHAVSYPASSPAVQPVPGPAAAAASGDQWGRVLALVKQRRPGLASLLEGSVMTGAAGQVLTVAVKGTGFQLGRVEEKGSRELVEQAVAEIFGRSLQVRFQLAAEASKAAPSKAGAPRQAAPPPDPIVQDALSIFNGTVVEPKKPEQ